MAADPRSDAERPTEPILETPRLRLRTVALSDGPFVYRLLNEPSWIENIGDRGVRSAADAKAYIRKRLWAHYQTHGYGTYVVQLKSTSSAIGICGLVKREFLPAPDLGFALLPEYTGRGYAFEAASGVLAHAARAAGIEQVYAIVKSGNARSIRLLTRLGFRQEGAAPAEAGREVALYIRMDDLEGDDSARS